LATVNTAKQQEQDRKSFEAISQSAVPHTRKGKHHHIVKQILAELQVLRGKKALKIPRTTLEPATIAQVRAALSRVSAKQKLALSTSVDDNYFYVWREK